MNTQISTSSLKNETSSWTPCVLLSASVSFSPRRATSNLNLFPFLLRIYVYFQAIESIIRIF